MSSTIFGSSACGCGCSNSNSLFARFIEGMLSITKGSTTAFTLALSGAFVELTKYGYQEFTMAADDEIVLDYANVGGDDAEVRLLVVVPEYGDIDGTVPDSRQAVKWKFDASSYWSTIGPFLMLSGAPNVDNTQDGNNAISQISLKNLSGRTVTIKVITGV